MLLLLYNNVYSYSFQFIYINDDITYYNTKSLSLNLAIKLV